MHELIKIVASYFILIPVGAALYALYVRKGRSRFELLLAFVLGGIISLLLAKVASHLYYDARPFIQAHFTPLLAHGNDNGFPSDHTLFASFVGWTLLRYSRPWGIGLLIVAALVGGARMAAGIHHLSDVVGSFVIAAVGVLLAWLVNRYLLRIDHGPKASSTAA